MKLKPPKRLEVLWRDIVASNSWEPDIPDVEPELCLTIGYFVSEDPKTLTISSTWSPSGDDRWNNVTAIPKGCILQRRVISNPKK